MATKEEEAKADADAKVLADKAAADAKAKADADAKAEAEKAGKGGKEDFVPEGVDKQVALKFAEKVRQQEKAKLYPKMEKMEKELKEKEAVLKEREEELASAKAALESKGAGTSEEGALLKTQISDLQKQIKQTNENIAREKTEAEQKLKNAELQAYRERKLRDAGDLIPELVAGATPEEIDASVEASKAKYQELYQKALADAQAKANGGKPKGASTTKPQAGQANGTADLTDPKVIREIPLKDWKAKRAEVLAAITQSQS